MLRNKVLFVAVYCLQFRLKSRKAAADCPVSVEGLLLLYLYFSRVFIIEQHFPDFAADFAAGRCYCQ
jgi:hypothetical protein